MHKGLWTLCTVLIGGSFTMIMVSLLPTMWGVVLGLLAALLIGLIGGLIYQRIRYHALARYLQRSSHVSLDVRHPRDMP